jgi:hypothetical protein
VADHRSSEWLASFIRRPDKVRAENDPITAGLIARFPGVRMPNLGITDLDAIDLISYLRTETARIEEGNKEDALLEQHANQHGHEHHHH